MGAHEGPGSERRPQRGMGLAPQAEPEGEQGVVALLALHTGKQPDDLGC